MKSLKKFITESGASAEDKYSCIAAFFLWTANKNRLSGKLDKDESEITKSLLHGVLSMMDDLGYLKDVDFDKFETYLLDKIVKQPSTLMTISNSFKEDSLYEDIDMWNGTQFIKDVLSDFYDGYLESVIEYYLDK